VFLPLPPLFDIRIPPMKVPRILLTPTRLSYSFTLLLTRLSMTRFLPISHSWIRDKKSLAKQTPLPQGCPPLSLSSKGSSYTNAGQCYLLKNWIKEKTRKGY